MAREEVGHRSAVAATRGKMRSEMKSAAVLLLIEILRGLS